MRKYRHLISSFANLKRILSRIALLLLFLGLPLNKSRAELMLTLDIINDTGVFTGSDAGVTPAPLMIGGVVQWESDLIAGLSSTPLPLGTDVVNPSASTVTEAFLGRGGNRLILNLELIPAATVTLTGTGNSFSYAGWANSAVIEAQALAGATWAQRPSGGTGAGPISLSVVPEPSGFFPFTIAILFALRPSFLFRRRRPTNIESAS